MQCRVFPYESATGPANMALDEALLEAVAADPRSAILRTYGWSEPTLSLGFFQQIAEAEADPRWRGAAIVRRLTGGGAIWHDHELTYALVIPSIHPLARPNRALYHGVHGAIARLLCARGVEAEPRGPVTPGPAGSRPFLCFADRDAEDLVCQGSKIVGSAQRRRTGVILQHGSLLLKRSPQTAEFAGASDLAAADPDPRFWSEILASGLPPALGLVPFSEDLPDTLRRRSAELQRAVYQNHAWNHRR